MFFDRDQMQMNQEQIHQCCLITLYNIIDNIVSLATISSGADLSSRTAIHAKVTV